MEAAPPCAAATALDLCAVSAQLARGDDGIWRAGEREPISYLEEDNDACFAFEDQSFWFAHRGACLRTIVRRFPPSGPIYDIGGGNGYVTRILLDAGFDAVLVEPGEAAVRNAAVRGIPMIVCATLASARFRAESLAAVGLFDVLEHIDDDLSFLRELQRALIPGGRLYLTVPAYSWLWSHDDVRAGHFRRHTISGMRRRLETTGWKLLYSTYIFSLLPAPIFVWRSLRSLFGRRVLPRADYARLHRARARSFTDRVWDLELRRLLHGRSIPFGSSCLLVAEKARTDA
jgi:SAM-dependent methyltransferase